MKVAVYDKRGKWISNTHPAKARKLLKKGKATVFRYIPFSIKIKKGGEKMYVSYGNSIVNLDKVEAIEIKDNKVMFFTQNMMNKVNWHLESEQNAKEIFEELKKILSTKDFKKEEKGGKNA